MLLLAQPCTEQPRLPARPNPRMGPGLRYLCNHHAGVGEVNAVTGRRLAYSYFNGDAITTSPRGVGKRPTATTLATVPVALGTDYTLIAVVSGWATGATAQCILDDDDGSTRVMQFRIYNNAATLLRFNIQGSVYGVDSAALSAAQNRNGIVMIGRSRGTVLDMVVDGIKTSGTLSGSPRAASGTLGVLGRSNATSPFTGIAHLTAAVAGALSDGEILALCDNPWQLFEDDTVWVFNQAGAAGAALAADGTGSTSASGDLTTGIPLLGAALAVSTGSAALTTGLPLAGAAASTTVASGQLVTSITLSGDALAQAVAGAALSSGIILTAEAVAQAAAQGSLATAIQLIGAAVASSTATGSLDIPGTGAALAGAASAQASASAALTVQIRLEAAALATAAATAGLDTGVLLAGAAAGNAEAAGALTTGIPLDAAALAAAIAAGGLTVEIRLGGQSAATAAGAAGLDTQIIVAGQAVAQATGSAALTTTPSSVADGPVWLIAGVAPLADYVAAVQPASTWSAAAAPAASYLAGVAHVQ